MDTPHKKSEEKKPKQKELSRVVKEPMELLTFLLAEFPDKSRTTIKSYLSHRQVSVNDRVVTQYNFPLRLDETVVLNFGQMAQTVQYHGLKIIYEDDAIIVIDKEEGLLSIATEKERQKTAYFILLEHVREMNPKDRVYVVHRLDKEASGLMMFAKSEDLQEKIQRDWKENIIDRRYAVLVEGKMENEEGTHTSWLMESKALIVYSYNHDNGGQKAITHYKVLQSNDDFSLLEAKLETGRKNQIRVHMQDLGHSIVGDKKYGSTQNPIRRMGLHAMLLSFKHPVSGKEMKFETPVPRKFLSVFNYRKTE
jgi:23S rRNA pseudouridine1911/1915/1917 synthase